MLTDSFSTESVFSRPCPTCNRNTRILIQYLGKIVRCRHCGRESLATDPAAESAALDDPVSYWLNFTVQDVSPTSEFDCNRQPK